jgi:hypothetical protein
MCEFSISGYHKTLADEIVAGQDTRTLDVIAEVYGSVVTAGLHLAPSINRWCNARRLPSRLGRFASPRWS